MYQVKCRIEGLIPSMWDKFYNIEDTETASTKKGKDAWKKELIKKLNVDKKGVYCPVDNIRMMLIGNKCRIGAAKILGSYIESNKGTEYLNFCNSCVWVVGLTDPLKVYFEPKRKTYDDYDERSFLTKAGQSTARKITRRPIIKTPWSLEFIVQVTDDTYSPEKIKEFFDVAGLRCGLGAYGPTFGRFIITEWEAVESLGIKPKKASRATKVPKNHNKAREHGKNKKKKAI